MLVELGQIKSNVIYAKCMSESVLTNHKDKGIDINNTVKIYYPQLYKSGFNTIEKVKESLQQRYDTSVTTYANIATQYKSINNIQNIYNDNKSLLNYTTIGIREIDLIYHPTIPFDIPIHLIFKIIHSSQSMPMVKYNPGKKQEKLYRLFTGEQISANGRKVPILPRTKISQLIKQNNNNNTVTCYCIDNEYVITFEFNSVGDIIIRYACELNIQKQPILKSTNIIEQIIRENLNAILQVINSVISESGIQYIPIESIIYNRYLEVLNIIYEYQISIENDIELTPYINCLSSFLIIQSPLLQNGIKCIFKSVPNYNKHNEKESLILKLINEKNLFEKLNIY